MKKYLILAALGLFGCGSTADSSSDPSSPVASSEQEVVRGGDVPSFAPAELSVSGQDEPLYGSFQLQVGPDASEKYTFTAYSRDGRTMVHGEIDLRGELRPSPLGRAAFTTELSAKDDYAFLGENRGAFNLVVDGQASSFAVRSAVVRVDETGRMTAELRGVDSARIDAAGRRIRPGEDRVLGARGRVVGTCMTKLPSGAMVMDPTNQAPRCKELFAGL
jgi:hypothetical protein